MHLALAQARLAAAEGEVPVGAVVVKAGQLVAVGRNAPVAHHDPSAHAEVQALRAAGQALGNYRLSGCTLYVTLEPCAMCSGAMLHARVDRVVYGAADPHTGAAGSALNLFAVPRLNAHTTVQGGVLAADCATELHRFFAPRRRNPAPLRDDALRTPEARFSGLANWPWATRTTADLPALAGLRLAWVDTAHRHAANPPPGQPLGTPTPAEAPAPSTAAHPDPAAPVLVCLPPDGTWGIVYSPLLLAMVAQGWRVLVPDPIGFGRSDKPKKPHWHTTTQHARVLGEWAQQQGLATAVWLVPSSGAMALVVADLFAQHPGLARAVVALHANGATAAAPDADGVPTDNPVWRAPFPDRGFLAGPKAFAALSPQPRTHSLPTPLAHLAELSPLNDLNDPTQCAALAQALSQWPPSMNHLTP